MYHRQQEVWDFTQDCFVSDQDSFSSYNSYYSLHDDYPSDDDYWSDDGFVPERLDSPYDWLDQEERYRFDLDHHLLDQEWFDLQHYLLNQERYWLKQEDYWSDLEHYPPDQECYWLEQEEYWLDKIRKGSSRHSKRAFCQTKRAIC